MNSTDLNSTDPNGTDPNGTDFTAPTRPRGRGLLLLAGGLALGLAAGGAVAASAATATDEPADTAQEQGDPGAAGLAGAGDRHGRGHLGGPGRDGGPGRVDGPGHFGGPGAPGGPGGLGGALHGELTVDVDGEYVEVLVQRGEVTAAAPTSLTVLSADGFEQTWVLDDETTVRQGRGSGTVDDLAVGDTVLLRGGTDLVADVVGERGTNPAGHGVDSPQSEATAAAAAA